MIRHGQVGMKQIAVAHPLDERVRVPDYIPLYRLLRRKVGVAGKVLRLSRPIPLLSARHCECVGRQLIESLALKTPSGAVEVTVDVGARHSGCAPLPAIN